MVKVVLIMCDVMVATVTVLVIKVQTVVVNKTSTGCVVDPLSGQEPGAQVGGQHEGVLQSRRRYVCVCVCVRACVHVMTEAQYNTG